MNPELSRRLGAVWTQLLLTNEQWREAQTAQRTARTFGDLPEWLRAAVLKAEGDQ